MTWWQLWKNKSSQTRPQGHEPHSRTPPSSGVSIDGDTQILQGALRDIERGYPASLVNVFEQDLLVLNIEYMKAQIKLSDYKDPDYLKKHTIVALRRAHASASWPGLILRVGQLERENGPSFSPRDVKDTLDPEFSDRYPNGMGSAWTNFARTGTTLVRDGTFQRIVAELKQGMYSIVDVLAAPSRPRQVRGHPARAKDTSNVGAITTRCIATPSGVGALAVLRDGRVAVGCRNGQIQLWDVDAGTEAARLTGEATTVRSLTMLSDGRLAAACFVKDQDEIWIWNTETGSVVQRLSDPQEKYFPVCLALPHGQIATTSGGSEIRIWDVDSNFAALRRLRDPKQSFRRLGVLNGGQFVSMSDYEIVVWDLETGTETSRLSGEFMDFAALPGGRLATSSRDAIKLWDLVGDKTSQLGTRGGQLAVLSDGRLLSYDGRALSVWDAERKLEVARCGDEGKALVHQVGARLLVCALPNNRIVVADPYMEPSSFSVLSLAGLK